MRLQHFHGPNQAAEGHEEHRNLAMSFGELLISVIVNPIDVARPLFFPPHSSHKWAEQTWSSSPSEYGQFRMPSLSAPQVRSRQINDADIERVVDLLTR